MGLDVMQAEWNKNRTEGRQNGTEDGARTPFHENTVEQSFDDRKLGTVHVVRELSAVASMLEQVKMGINGHSQ